MKEEDRGQESESKKTESVMRAVMKNRRRTVKWTMKLSPTVK
jgi:hypothetical protein